MKKIISALIAGLAIFAAVAIAPPAAAGTYSSGIRLSNGDDVYVYTYWSCNSTNTRETPVRVGLELQNAGTVYTVVYDQSLSGRLIHREWHTFTGPTGSYRAYGGASLPVRPGDMNVTVKSGGLNGTKLGAVRVPGNCP